MKRALILSPFFYPEPISTGKYNSWLASALAEHGIEVTVYCSHPLYPDWKIAPSSRQLPGCTTIRGGSRMHYPAHPVARRLVLETWFAIFSLRQLIRDHDFDFIIPVFPPSLFGVLLPLFKPAPTRVIGIVHDLQGVYAANSAGILHKLLRRFIHLFEGIAFRHCDHLVYLSEHMRNTANSVYGIETGKTSVQYPFVTIDRFENTGTLRQIIPDNRICMVYSGALGNKQAPDRIMQLYHHLLAHHPQLHCYIFSSGPEFERLRATNHHERLHFHQLVAEENLPELLLRSSIQLLPQEPGTADGSLPSKLPNILACDTRILCITDPDSELVDIINQYPRGCVATDWDYTALAEMVARLLQLPGLTQPAASNSLLARFTRQGLVQRIIATP